MRQRIRRFIATGLRLSAATTITAALALMLTGAAPARGADMTLGIAPWPPYVGPDLPEHGAAGAVVVAALRAAGHSLRPVYHSPMPVEDGVTNPDVDGLFPVYARRVRERACLMSSQIGSSPLGLAERLDAPLTWSRLEDLGAYTIGVVRHYANAEPFDRLVGRGIIRVVRAETDSDNLRGLIAGTVDAAIIDRNTMAWLLARDPALAAGGLRFHPRPVAERPLYVCFRTDERGRQARDILETGLGRIDAPLITAEWFRRHMSGY